MHQWDLVISCKGLTRESNVLDLVKCHVSELLFVEPVATASMATPSLPIIALSLCRLAANGAIYWERVQWKRQREAASAQTMQRGLNGSAHQTDLIQQEHVSCSGKSLGLRVLGSRGEDHTSDTFRGAGCEEGRVWREIRSISSCRSAAPGAGRCGCASPEGGCGCNGPRWAAAEGSGPKTSGRNFHKTPEEEQEGDVRVTEVMTLWNC